MQTAGRVCSAFARIFRAAMHASPPSFKHETHLHSGPHRMFAAKHTQYLRWWRWEASTRIASELRRRLRLKRAAHRLMHPERSQWHAPAAMLLRFLRRGPPESPTLDAASSSAAAEPEAASSTRMSPRSPIASNIDATPSPEGAPPLAAAAPLADTAASSIAESIPERPPRDGRPPEVPRAEAGVRPLLPGRPRIGEVREPGVRRCPIVASSHAAAAASQSPSSSESVSPSGFCGRFAFAGFGGR